MTVGYHKLNPVATPILFPVPDVILLTEQVNTFPSILYTVIDLVNALSLETVNKGHRTKFAFSWQ